jgi:hypothetical protein
MVTSLSKHAVDLLICHTITGSIIGLKLDGGVDGAGPTGELEEWQDMSCSFGVGSRGGVALVAVAAPRNRDDP